MIRIFITFIATFITTISMAQDQPFNTTLDSLFFGVDIGDTSSSLIDSLRKIPKLNYKEPAVRQQGLNEGIRFGSDAWSSRHVFTFSESPLRHLRIRSGQIYLTLIETPSTEKITGKLWIAEFDDKADADSFFNHLKFLFEPLSTKKSVGVDEEGYHIAEYSTHNSSETGIRNIQFALGKQHEKPGYQILLALWNGLYNDAR